LELEFIRNHGAGRWLRNGCHFFDLNASGLRAAEPIRAAATAGQAVNHLASAMTADADVWDSGYVLFDLSDNGARAC